MDIGNLIFSCVFLYWSLTNQNPFILFLTLLLLTFYPTIFFHLNYLPISNTNFLQPLTVVEWKDCHFLAVAAVSDLQNSYCNQWTHPYEPQISNRFVFSAICLHFTAVLVKFSEKTSAIKTKSPQTKWHCQGV